MKNHNVRRSVIRWAPSKSFRHLTGSCSSEVRTGLLLIWRKRASHKNVTQSKRAIIFRWIRIGGNVVYRASLSPIKWRRGKLMICKRGDNSASIWDIENRVLILYTLGSKKCLFALMIDNKKLHKKAVTHLELFGYNRMTGEWGARWPNG